jgi:hypothetical protein
VLHGFGAIKPEKSGVIAGLDPAIHGAVSTMDARVEPGHDALCI